MADVWPMKFTGADREKFGAWLARCQEAGAARTMTDALRLAVRLADSISEDDLRKMGAGK
jgi:hypothetical protein